MSICDSIKRKYIRLSKGQRKVAQFVVDNPATVVSHVAVEVGRLAGVSESTVIRFCYSMDLAGFSELQEKLRHYLIETGEMVPVPQAKTEKVTKQKNTMMMDNVACIKGLMDTVKPDQIQNAAQLIHGANEVHILSFEQSTPTASWLYQSLKQTKSNTFLHEYSTVLTNEKIVHVEQQATVIVFGEHHYNAQLRDVLSLMKESVNVFLIAPEAMYLDEVNASLILQVKNAKHTQTYPSAAVISLLEAVLEEMKQAVAV